MNPRVENVTWLDSSETMGMAELARVCGMAPEDIEELVEYGALVPVNEARDFGAHCVGPLRAAARLRLTFDLDLFTVGLLLGYLSRIEGLERQVRSLQAHLPGHVVLAHRDGPGLWHEPHA
jgi:chaperone modulatory protein CbpM